MVDMVERFTDLYRRYYPKVMAYAARRVDAASASDVVAETFLAAWRHVDRLPADPLPWLYRTAGQCLRNQARSRRRQQRLTNRVSRLPETSFVVPDHADSVSGVTGLMTALARLDEVDREVLLLVAWEGLQPATAAYVLGCSAVAFRVRLHRARQRLARLLEEPVPSIHLVDVKE